MKVCVVGAGPCGPTTIKQLLDEGHEVVCFEKNPDVGGIWLRDADGADAAQMKAYDTLMLTISMKLMAYSDHPYVSDGSRGEREFCSRAQYFDYLKGYAERFGLFEHIRAGHEVVDVTRDGTTWRVDVRDAGDAAGAVRAERFDAVAVCSGAEFRCARRCRHATSPGCSAAHSPRPPISTNVIEREKEWEECWTALSPLHTEAIPSRVPYLDALAREIGCLIPMRMMLTNPKLFIQLWFGSFNPSCYRVVGPHNLGDAALTDLYSELVDNRREMAFRMSMLQLMPSHVHPEHMM